MTFARSSLVVLAVQLALVSSIAAKYLYERHSCPRVWTRAVAYDPELVLRGRYLSMQLYVDACGVNLLSLADSKGFEHSDKVAFKDGNDLNENIDGRVGTQDGKLVLISLDRSRNGRNDQSVFVRKGATCHDAVLTEAVTFYLSEHAQTPFPLAKGTTLWVEVTVPPQGPPRPIHLALSEDGKWKPF